jgi:hypothetical protein
MTPPAPPIAVLPSAASGLSTAELDFDFSAPLESFAPLAPANSDSQEGPALEMDDGDGAQDDDSAAQFAADLVPVAAASAPPTDSIDLDFGDMVGDDMSHTDGDELVLKPAVSVAPLAHYANISSHPPGGHSQPSIPAPSKPVQTSEPPSISPSPAPAPASRAPSAVTQSKPSNAAFSAERQAERIERAWHLIENSQFEEAQDVMEVLRASGQTDEVRALQRSLDERLHEHRLELLGGPSAVLSVVTGSTILRTMNMDPRAAFLFSMVDGVSSVEDLCDVANMSPTQTVMYLVDLVERGLIR